MPIRILPSTVVDQIAAGEVVERPAHLMKELIENALDAGAKTLDIEFNQGGRSVRVRDDGTGIPEEELPLALARHATSKIETSADLWALKSFGFRGEALASIAAVSNLQIISKTRDQATAFSIKSEFGQIGSIEAVGGQDGTTLVVEDLLANVPARLKFLKSEAAEHGQIKNVIKAMAMANPQVTFRVRHKGELLYFWPAEADLKLRVQQILEAKEVYFAEGEAYGIRVRAVMSSPHETFNSRKQIWLFAQQRCIQDSTLQAAVLEAYRHLLMHGEYPLAVVFVDTDPSEIDVNIHPTKSQVKFRNSSGVFRAVNQTLRSCLEKAPWLKGLTPTAASWAPPPPPPVNESFALPELERVQYAHKSYQPAPAPVVESLSTATFVAEQKVTYAETPLAPQGDFKTHQDGLWSRLQVLGQAQLTYIISQSDKALFIIDQHAAHERVMFERLMKSWNSQNIEVQSFLLPLSVDMDGDRVEALMMVAPELQRIGIELDQVGPGTIALRAAPAMIEAEGLVKALDLLAEERLEKGESFAIERALGELFSTMACHSAIRAGQALSHQEMSSLLVQMDEFPLSSFCPHGRPVYIEMPFSRLEKDFGRTV